MSPLQARVLFDSRDAPVHPGDRVRFVDREAPRPPAAIAFMGASWDTFPTRQRPAGHAFDPFCGSGSTLVAARLEGFRAIGIDEDAESIETTQRRIAWASHQPALLELP